MFVVLVFLFFLCCFWSVLVLGFCSYGVGDFAVLSGEFRDLSVRRIH